MASLWCGFRNLDGASKLDFRKPMRVTEVIKISLLINFPNEYHLKNLRTTKKEWGSQIPVTNKQGGFTENDLPEEEKEYQKLVEKDLQDESREASSLMELAQENTKGLESFSLDEVLDARKTAAELIKAGVKVEQMIMKLGDEKKLSNVLLQVIKNRAGLARMDKDEDAQLCLDMLYKRIETERKKREAPPALRLLNELLHLPGYTSQTNWRNKVEQRMKESFVAEDPSLIFRPIAKMAQLEGDEGENRLYRIDFVTEVDELLYEATRSTPSELPPGSDDAAMAVQLRLSERRQALDQVRNIRDIAIQLRWTK